MEKFILIPYEKYQRLQRSSIEARKGEVSKPKDPILDTVRLPPPGRREHKKKPGQAERKENPSDATINWISF